MGRIRYYPDKPPTLPLLYLYSCPIQYSINGFNGMRVEDGGLDDGLVFLPVEGLVGLIHDKDGDEYQNAEFEDAEQSAEESVCPAEVDGVEQAHQQPGGVREDDGYQQENRHICHYVTYAFGPFKPLQETLRAGRGGKTCAEHSENHHHNGDDLGDKPAHQASDEAYKKRQEDKNIQPIHVFVFELLVF